ncbi:MAG TPA: flagellar basal body-associated FliL family protein [Methylomirabilota bacterium]|nr:flagellar basal body-associated FliL family protein [Methylomirabilota bacterium]
MPKTDPWNQALTRESKSETASRPVPIRDREPSRRMHPVIMAGSMIVMAIVALALVLFVLKPLLVPGDNAQAKPKPTPSYSLGAMVVNVAETDGRRFLKAAIEVEPNGPKGLKEIEARRSQLVDLSIALLSSKSLADVATVEGRERIKKELVERMNAELGGEKISRIYFVEFVVQ